MISREEHEKLRHNAARETHRAIARGLLPTLNGLIKCVDCGKPAVCYDHRDYRRPLDVEPVCKSCNNFRGPALPKRSSRKLGKSNGTRWANTSEGESNGGFVELPCHVDLSEIILAEDEQGEYWHSDLDIWAMNDELMKLKKCSPTPGYKKYRKVVRLPNDPTPHYLRWTSIKRAGVWKQAWITDDGQAKSRR